MIDGSARRIVLAGIGCPRGDVDQGGDLRVHSPTGLSVTQQNSLGRYADVSEMLPPGMSTSVTAAACGFGDDADE